MLTIVNGAPASDGPLIHVERSGSGPADLLLIHGLGSRSEDFSRLISRMDAGRSIVAPDLRGHGASEASLPVTVEAFASDLLPLLDEEGPLALAGFSFGCWVAMELWRTRPGMVSELILVDPPLTYGPLFRWASKGGSGRQRVRSVVRSVVDAVGLEDLGRRMARSLSVPRDEAIRKLTAIYYAPDLEEAIELMRENPLTGDLGEADLVANANSLMAADRETLLAGLELTGDPDGQTGPPGSKVEPVVLFGEKSPVTDPESAEAFAGRIGGRAISYGGGHAAHLETPGEIAAVIEDRLEEHP